MNLKFLPDNINSVTDSDFKLFLKRFRIFSLLTLIALNVWNYYMEYFEITSYYTLIMLYSLPFQVFSILSYYINNLNQITTILFLMAWDYSTTLVSYNIYLSLEADFYLYDLTVFITFFVLLIEFILNKISFIRIQYVFPLGLLLIDIYLREEEIDYEAYITEVPRNVFIVILILVGLIMLELSRLMKMRMHEESEIEESLI